MLTGTQAESASPAASAPPAPKLKRANPAQAAPGFAAVVGAAHDKETAVRIARELQEKNLYVFIAGSSPEGKTFAERFWIHDHFRRLGSGVHTTTPGGGFDYFVEQLGYGLHPWVAALPGGLGLLARAADEWRTPAGGKLDRYLEAELALHPGFSGGLVLDLSGVPEGGRAAALARAGQAARGLADDLTGGLDVALHHREHRPGQQPAAGSHDGRNDRAVLG